MKRLLGLSLLLGLAVPCAFGQGIRISAGAPAAQALTIVQHKSTHCVAATCALSFTSNNVAGNTLIYMCAGQESSVAMSAAIDNNSNTIVNANLKTTAAGAIRVDYVASANAGANQVTCGETGAIRVHIHIWEVSGLTSKVLDQNNTGSQAATSQSISTSSGTTAANEIVFGFFYDQPTDDSLTAGSGYNPSEFNDGGAGNESSLSEVKIVSSTGTQTATATCGSASDAVLQSVATFK
jgi:hypothetical protein